MTWGLIAPPNPASSLKLDLSPSRGWRCARGTTKRRWLWHGFVICIESDENMAHLLRKNFRNLITVGALAVLFMAFIHLHPRGFSTYVLTIWSNQCTLLALAALAQFSVVLISGIDLSVGAMVALTNVVASYTLVGSGPEIALGFAIVILTGIACGLLNGILVVYGHIQPIVATLATASVFTGIALLLRPVPGGTVDEAVSDALTYDLYHIPVSLIIVVLLGALLTLILRKTSYGLSLYAIGSAEGSAYLTGVKVSAVKLAAYAQGGFFAALTGIFLAMVTLTGDPNVAPSYTLNSVAAVVLGGVALSGGQGSAFNAIVGALILKTIASMMFFTGLPPLAQPFFEGLILAFAIAVGAISVLRNRNRLKVFG